MILDLALLAAGATIVAFVLYDLTSTAVSLSTVRGPLSTRLSELVWGLSRRTAGTRFATVQRYTGPLLVLIITIAWLVGLTIGWTLVFSMDGALARAADPDQQSSPVRWVDSFFFVFGSLIGRSSSNLSPDEAMWSSVVAVMTLTGVGLLTLALAWILPIVSAVVQKRALAAKLSALGGTPEDIVLSSWTGRDLGDLNLHLLPLIDGLTQLAQHHLAYPVIHYFHSSDHRTAIGPRVAALDEALTLIEASGLDDVDRGTRLDRSTTRPVRQAISDYLSTLEHIFITADDHVPPPPCGDRLVAGGLVDRSELDERLPALCRELTERRALLHGYVQHDGWTWDAVADDHDAETHDPERTR